ncbi:MAG: hypothetical protein HY064_07345 [Bacteroidetes bacterium]|nr:hypothetical protein [Bacteroidota bacterium]
MIDRYSKKNGFRINWDQECGEEWGMLINKNELVLYFSAKLPLIFVSTNYISEMKQMIDERRVIIVEVQDFDARIYSLNTSVSDSILKWHSSIPSEGISIKDLWFATI